MAFITTALVVGGIAAGVGAATKLGISLAGRPGRIREQNIYCLVHPYNKINSEILNNKSLSGIILSGGPNSVRDKKSPKLNKKIRRFDPWGLYYDGVGNINKKEFNKAISISKGDIVSILHSDDFFCKESMFKIII